MRLWVFCGGGRLVFLLRGGGAWRFDLGFEVVQQFVILYVEGVFLAGVWYILLFLVFLSLANCVFWWFMSFVLLKLT